jgi:acetyl esterase/lipase
VIKGNRVGFKAIQPYLHLNKLLWQASLSTWLHRLRHEPRQADWSREFEIMVQMLALGLPHRVEFDVDEIRVPWEHLAALPILQHVTIQPAQIEGMPGEWVSSPETEDGPVVLFLHGGGYIAGSPRTHRLLTAQIARVSAARVLALDYRLAPEYPYPAAVTDAWCAYGGLLAQGIAPGEIIIAGDSAGGGLTMALLLALRDAHLPMPAGAVGLSPWLDLALQGESLRTNAEIDYLNEQVLQGAAQMYLAGVDPHTPLASPLYADLHGLPPLLIQASTTELLVDDSRHFAERAQAAGVQVELELYENLVHVWHFFYLIAQEARQAIEHIGRFIHERTGKKVLQERGF